MPTTSPDNIYSTATTAPQDQAAWSQIMASSVQTALNSRQRYSYVWPNDAARLNQTGMTESSLGYQLDTKTEYQYENSSWRLATPHAVFSATKTVGTGLDDPVGSFSVNTTLSSSTTFATAGGSQGLIVLTDPGLYAIGSTSFINSTDGAQTAIYADLRLNTLAAIPYYRGSASYPGSQLASVAAPNVRTTAPGAQLYFTFQQKSGQGLPLQTEVRITRIG